VKFADLFNTGRQDMLVAPSTDMQHYGPGYVFSNQGNHFNRIAIPLNNVWAHDSAIADMDGDGLIYDGTPREKPVSGSGNK
jgi:hypothetical protein